MKKTIPVSIIIPVRDDSRIRRCVESVLNQTIQRKDYEIIVVDNGSSKFDISSLLADLPVTLLYENCPGLSLAVNMGLKVARGEFLIRIDADCIADPNWLKELLVPFDDLNVGAVGGAIYKETGDNLIEIAARDLVIGNQLSPQYLPMYDAPYVVTANAAYRLNLVREIGGFDENFISGSDVDISWRIYIAGYKIITAQNAIVFHPSRPSIRLYFRQFYLYGIGHAYLFKKYKEITKKKILVNVYPFRGIVRLCLYDTPRLFYFAIKRKGNITAYLTRMLLDLTEYVALICGDVVGALKYKILYF